ncbi:hypothetical protein [Sulfoacidibacillus thermotolerans]|nr:hypothetical protein [Sulfoacidibacillus thermotolerans]
MSGYWEAVQRSVILSEYPEFYEPIEVNAAQTKEQMQEITEGDVREATTTHKIG